MLFNRVLSVLFITILNCMASGIQPDSIRHHIRVLGDDAMLGRGTGTDGTLLASRYIAARLTGYGIAPPPGGDGYFQYIPMHGSYSLPATRLTLSLPDTQLTLMLSRDYLIQNLGTEILVRRPLALVFVGYGIIAPEFDYNDYSTVDVEDKIVVFLAGEPKSSDTDYFGGVKPTIYSNAEIKRRIAASRGARGSILIPVNQPDTRFSWSKLEREFTFEDIRLAYTVNTHLSLVINPGLLPYLFSGNQNIFNMHATGNIRSFELPLELTFEGRFIERDFRDRNVIGFIAGADPELEDRYLILSAHYDHLGVGKPVSGDSIYNGVVDNASGTAALLEIARVMALAPVKPRRSVIFLFVTGEEKGLLGSTFYTDNPVVPLYKTIANINIDGLALFDEFWDVIAIGSEYSTIEDELFGLLGDLNLQLSALPEIFFDESESLTRSDQFAFARAGIPSVLIVDGLNRKHTEFQAAVEQMISWNLHIYHSPFDDLNQNFNFKAAGQHAEIIYRFAMRLAGSDREPEWRRGAPFYTARLRSIAEKK